MARVSPTLEGFRAAFRRPSLTFAEIAWRWTVGATAWMLILFGFFEYLNTLPVSGGDAALLATRQPAFVGRAIAHILRGSLDRVVLAALCAALALAILWIMAASFGRATTAVVLVDYFREKSADDLSSDKRDIIEPRPFGSLVGLHFLRVAVILAVVCALVGAAILAGFASSDAKPQPGLVFVVFLPLAGLICVVGWGLGWLLSLAAVFGVRDGDDAIGAVSAAVALCRERTGAVFAVGTWTGVAHFVAFTMAITAISLPLGLIQVVPTRLVVGCIILVALAYFAVVDWLYMARLAGYVCIAEMPDALVSPEVLPAPPPAGWQFAPGPPVLTTIDREEPILSDVPSPIVSA